MTYLVIQEQACSYVRSDIFLIYRIIKTFLQAVIDYLKFDIEWSEWEAIPVMLKDGSLKNVKQMAFEIHLDPSKVAALKSKLKLLKEVETFGFRKWYAHENGANAYNVNKKRFTGCVEVVYINSKFLQR